MELPAPFFSLAEHFAIDLPGARVVFSTRRGGRSDGPYASLNLGLLTDDEPARVSENRRSLAAAVGAPPLRFVHQVHGVSVETIDGPADPSQPLPDVDGQVTAHPGVAPVALTADCLPVAIAGTGAVAMVHAGWRGLAGGVIAEGVRAVRALGAGGPLSAAIGPGAGPCCYETGEEVHAAFASIPGARRGENADLKAVAVALLRSAGVGEVADIGMCTICADPGLFFSHRRDHGVTGRQGGLAWLT